MYIKIRKCISYTCTLCKKIIKCKYSREAWYSVVNNITTSRLGGAAPSIEGYWQILNHNMLWS
jgi:hypothetical protein